MPNNQSKVVPVYGSWSHVVLRFSVNVSSVYYNKQLCYGIDNATTTTTTTGL